MLYIMSIGLKILFENFYKRLSQKNYPVKIEWSFNSFQPHGHDSTSVRFLAACRVICTLHAAFCALTHCHQPPSSRSRSRLQAIVPAVACNKYTIWLKQCKTRWQLQHATSYCNRCNTTCK